MLWTGFNRWNMQSNSALLWKNNASVLFITVILILSFCLWRGIIVQIPLGAEMYVLSRLYGCLLKLAAFQRNASNSTSLPNNSFFHWTDNCMTLAKGPDKIHWVMEDYCNRHCKHVILARVLIKFGEWCCCLIADTREWEFLLFFPALVCVTYGPRIFNIVLGKAPYYPLWICGMTSLFNETGSKYRRWQ